MGMEIYGNYGAYGNYAAQMETAGAAGKARKRETEREAGKTEEGSVVWSREANGTTGTESALKNSAENKAARTAEYWKELEKLVPSAKCSVGTSFAASQSGKTLTIHPKLLEKMQNDPEKEKEMKELLKGVESAMTMLDSVMNAQGWSVVFKNDYIDENGKYHQVCLVRNDFMLNLSDELREERRENEKKLIEKTKERAAESKEKISEEIKEKLEKKNEISAEITGKAEENKKIRVEVKATADGNEAYLKKLQKGLSFMKLSVGEGFGSAKGAITHNITIHPRLLEKMQSDPAAEQEYRQRLQDIERASKLVNNYYHMKGRVEYYNDQWYIDENGNHQHFAQTVVRDTMNEELREQARENAEKHTEKIRERARENSKELAEKLMKKKEAVKAKAGQLKESEKLEKENTKQSEKSANGKATAPKVQPKSGIKVDIQV